MYPFVKQAEYKLRVSSSSFLTGLSFPGLLAPSENSMMTGMKDLAPFGWVFVSLFLLHRDFGVPVLSLAASKVLGYKIPNQPPNKNANFYTIELTALRHFFLPILTLFPRAFSMRPLRLQSVGPPGPVASDDRDAPSVWAIRRAGAPSRKERNSPPRDTP